MPEDFGITVELAGDRALLRVHGEVDVVTAPELGAVLEAVAAGPRSSAVLDLGDVTFMDARGLGVVARSVSDLRPSGRRLTLRSVDAFRARLLAIAELDQLVDLEPPAAGPAVAADLARTMALPADQAVLEAALRLVVAVAQSTVAGADGVSISLARHGRIRTVAATDATVTGMDEDQYLSGQGPCLDAAEVGHGVYVAALAEEERWPGFVPRARARGIESILSTPLRLSDEPTGALNIYSFTANAFAGEEQELAGVFAARASQLLADAGIWMADEAVAARLREALHLRAYIAVAQGIVMAHEGGSMDAAYTTLLRRSRETGRELRELAAEVIASVAPPGAPGPPVGTSGETGG